MKNSINESFVDELLKSGVWDVARVGHGSREENVIEEAAEVSSEEEISARQLAEELLMNLDEDIILEFIDLVYQNTLNEEEEYEEDYDINEEEKDDTREMPREEMTPAELARLERHEGRRGVKKKKGRKTRRLNPNKPPIGSRSRKGSWESQEDEDIRASVD